MNLNDFLKLNVLYAADDGGGDGDGEAIDGAPPGAGDDGGNADGTPPAPKDGLMSMKFDDDGKPVEDKADDDKDGDDKLDDGRPDWVPEKFWDADKGEVNSEAMAKSYATLEAAHAKLKAGKGMDKAPENPDGYFDADKPFEVPKEADRVFIEPDDPGLKAYAKVAHKYGLSKDQFEGLARDYMLEVNGMLAAPLDPQAEMEKLGKNGQAVVQANRTWAEGLYKSGTIKDEHIEIMYDIGKTAAGQDLLNLFRGMSGEKPIPLSEVGGTGMTRAEYQAKMNDLVAKDDWAGIEALDKRAEAEGLF
jgi:hypothetical protein